MRSTDTRGRADAGPKFIFFTGSCHSWLARWQSELLTSHLPGFEVGDLIFGLHHWEDYSLSDANTILLSKLTPEADIPLSYYAGGLGGSGHTAYVGLHEIGQIQAGDTVVISAAAGATGSMATQIATLRGCKVVGIAGGDNKCQIVTESLGADAAINYKTWEAKP